MKKRHTLSYSRHMGGSVGMKQMIGYTCFMIAIGMLLMMFIEHAIIAFIVAVILLVVGFNLFCG